MQLMFYGLVCCVIAIFFLAEQFVNLLEKMLFKSNYDNNKASKYDFVT